MSTHLLSVGVNQTPLASKALHFAEADAVRFVRLFTSSRGPVDPGDANLILGTDATVAAVREHLQCLAIFPPQNLYFGWCGHGNEDGIALADGALSYAELGHLLGRINARTKVAVFSTCHSGSAAQLLDVRVAGLAGFDRAWHEVLQAACPGLRLFMAGGPNDLAYEDGRIRGSRFMFAFRRALTCAPGDIVWDGRRWISDLSLLPIMRAIIAAKWPNEAMPRLMGPSAACGAFPMLLSQSEAPIGFAPVQIVAAPGAAVLVQIFPSDRRGVDTRVEVDARVDDGTTIFSSSEPFTPMTDAGVHQSLYTLSDHDLLQHHRTSWLLRSGRRANVTWYGRTLDDHGHVLGTAELIQSYQLGPGALPRLPLR